MKGREEEKTRSGRQALLKRCHDVYGQQNKMLTNTKIVLHVTALLRTLTRDASL